MGQTWPRKEIIIVDDGSSDSTLAVARRFESGSVKVISQHNRGASAARNKALECAQGDYIQWLDADDLLDQNKISEQMRVAAGGQTPLTVLSSSYARFYWRQEKASFNPDELWQDLSPVAWLMKMFSDNLWMVPAVWLVSRTLTEKAGPWDERLSLNDDGEYFCRVVAASDRVRFVREARSYYRLSGYSQLSRKRSDASSESMLLSLLLCIGHLRSLEDSERTRTASLILLNRWLYFFYYAGNTERLDTIYSLARELGGELSTPTLALKWDIIRRLFGYQAAERAMDNGRKLRFMTKLHWDRFLYLMTAR